ncbi:SPOR domain-containing protein [Taylorella equigenitalis]|uniref:SPOR domain-containing protein n=1 Tax=Taylorella equigenitalis TaxID=29575 RepID=UPI00237CFECD|nr:SPOR domain-containing protein [Taylorella equigenitalis]WDU54137.1 SPOR domain-containing protein [Taylorella equigenitalis]
MGIFKASGNQRNPIQKSKIAQQQSNDLKHRARSKLIGALVLAIVAIILLPLIFDNDKPIKGTNNTAPLEAPIKTNPKDPVQVVISPTTPSDEPSTDVKPIVKNQNNNGQSIAQGTISNEPVEEESSIEPSKPAEEPKPVVTNKEPKQDKKNNSRTDDGSKARAILQGKQPTMDIAKNETKETSNSNASNPPSGKFSVQVASLNNMSEARKLRDKLTQSGVSNTFIQTATVNGKQAFRLRVGPFGTKESAQAALARLRALGYSDGFISNK